MQRFDSRRPNEIRPVTFTRQFTRYAPGSVLMELGATKVLVTASIDERTPRHVPDNEGWLTAEYGMLPGATHDRVQRDRNKVSGRTTEIQRLIGRSLRACVDLTKLGERTITIDADVIQADGGTRTASITAGYVALVDALRHLQAKGSIETLPIISPIAAISVGIVNGTPILDLCYEEDSTADVDGNIVMNARGEIIEFQTTSEKAPFSKDQLFTILDLAQSGINDLLTLQAQALGEFEKVSV